MRFLFVSNLYPPHHLGGYEQVCFRTAEGLKSRGHELHILTSSYQSGQQATGEVRRVLRCAYRPPDYFPDASTEDADSNARILADEIRRVSPDAIILWNLHGLGMNRLYATAIENSPHVATRIGDYQLWPNWAPSAGIPTGLLTSLRDPRMRIAANCRTMGEEMATAGLDRHGIAYLYSPVEMSVAPVADPPDMPPVRLLWAGRITVQKGLDVAVDAAITLATEHRIPVTLDIVGKGDETMLNSCLARAAGSPAAGSGLVTVNYLGQMDRQGLASVFPTYHAYLAPSVGHEAFPLTCVEAMAAGVPVVASRLGGLIEIVQNGKLGLLFEPGNSNEMANQIARLARDRALWKRLGTTARAYVESVFNEEAALDRFEAFTVACGNGLKVESMGPAVPKLVERAGYANSLLGFARNLFKKSCG